VLPDLKIWRLKMEIGNCHLPFALSMDRRRGFVLLRSEDPDKGFHCYLRYLGWLCTHQNVNHLSPSASNFVSAPTHFTIRKLILFHAIRKARTPALNIVPSPKFLTTCSPVFPFLATALDTHHSQSYLLIVRISEWASQCSLYRLDSQVGFGYISCSSIT
jgi:hypothetical protein